MKKVFFLMFLAFTMVATAFAQEESEHLTFKSVPIDGTLNEYVAKMQQAGFTHIGALDGTEILQGNFAGFKGCTIGVATLKATDNVNTIGVIFPRQNDWVSLENNYTFLKSMLTEKYGKPSDCVETFQGGSPQTDSDKLYKLTGDECTWCTTYSTPKGDIQLSLKHLGIVSRCVSVVGCCVLLRYFDKINTDAVRKQAMDDL